jgi:hypothetical protein
VSESREDVGVDHLGVVERGQDALAAFLHDGGEQAVSVDGDRRCDV